MISNCGPCLLCRKGTTTCGRDSRNILRYAISRVRRYFRKAVTKLACRFHAKCDSATMASTGQLSENERPRHRPFLIGVSGGTASGKVRDGKEKH